MDLFTLSAKLELDLQNFNDNLDKAVAAGEQFSQSFDSKVVAKGVAWGNMISAAGARLGHWLLDLGADMIDAAAAVQAERAQFEAAFGDIADAANAAFDSVGKDTNILATRLRTVGTKAFSQFKGAGIDAAEALGQTERYMRLAADAAAYYDISLEDADTRLRSFLRGNTEAGDAIGLFTSEAQRNTYATEQYGKKWQELTEAQKQMLMLNVAENIYKQSGAIGQAAREGDSWANVMANLSETWRQILATVGIPLIQAVIPHIQRFGEWLQSNQPLVEQFANTIGDLVGAVLEGLQGLIEWIGANGPAIMDSIKFIFSLFSGGDKSVVSEGQTFGDYSAWLAVEDWRKKALLYDIDPTEANLAAQQQAWATASAALGGEEAASEFAQAFNEYLAKNDLTYEAQVPADWFASAQSEMQSQLDQMDLSVDVDVVPSLSGFASSAIGVASKFANATLGNLSSHATGLDYVPHDDYVARLHEGEAVLTKLEANEWRRGGNGASIDGGALGGAIARAVSDALAGFAVYMDGQKVGDLVTDTVSRNIANNAHAGRYA